ncbi:hypothetical protein Hanom_Chr14g01278801 [Helianthus anomalus]
MICLGKRPTNYYYKTGQQNCVTHVKNHTPVQLQHYTPKQETSKSLNFSHVNVVPLARCFIHKTPCLCFFQHPFRRALPPLKHQVISARTDTPNRRLKDPSISIVSRLLSPAHVHDNLPDHPGQKKKWLEVCTTSQFHPKPFA